MMNSFSVKPIPAEKTRDLRHRILRPHQTIEQCVYPGDEKDDTFHLAAMTPESKIVCVGSFYKEASPLFQIENQYRLRGMATDLDFRRRGAGAELLRRSFEILGQRGCPFLWCFARQVAFDFYTSMGFEFFGDLFEISGIGPHKVMFKKFSL